MDRRKRELVHIVTAHYFGQEKERTCSYSVGSVLWTGERENLFIKCRLITLDRRKRELVHIVSAQYFGLEKERTCSLSVGSLLWTGERENLFI